MKIALAVLAVVALMGFSFHLGAQAPSTQTSATLQVSCMSDGSMRIVGAPKP